MTRGVPSEFLEQLKAKNDIVDVASKYLTLNRRGGNFWACCPFHNEKTPSFSIKPDGQFYKCFGCGESGNVITLVMKLENVDFLTAVEILAKNAGLEMPTNEDNEEIKKRKRQRDIIYQILRATTDFYHNNLLSNPNSPQAEYLHKRGLNSAMIEKFQIGASLNYEALPKHLSKLGFKPDDMVAAGVVGKNEYGLYDFYGNRLIFPIFNGFGDVVAYSGRSIEQSPDHTKYKNTPQTLVFNKSEILFGYNFVRDLKKNHMLDSIVIVEGHIDVIMCHQAGITNTIGCMGTALTPIHARNIKNLVNDVILCLDGDSAGNNATYKAIDTLKDIGLNVRVVRLTGAKDPDEYIKKFGKDAFLEFLQNSTDCVDFILNDTAKKYNLNNNAEKSKYVTEALNYISKFSTLAEQEIYLSSVQAKVKIPMDALRKSLQNASISPKSQQLIETEPAEPIKNKYIMDSKIMLLAGILYKKINNFSEIAGLFNSNDELSELYRFLTQKIAENEHFNASTLFDNFEIDNKSLIDKVINFNFPADEVFSVMIRDTIKRVKLYELQQEKDRLTRQIMDAKTDEERYNYLNQIKTLTEQINKEKM